MDKKILKWLLASVAAVGLASCQNNIEPVEVITPRNEIDTETLDSHKSSVLGRPIVMAMHYGWGTGNGSGVQLYRLPDYLDVVVVKETMHDLLPWMAEDLKITQEVKQTKILNSIDYRAIESVLMSDLKKAVKKQRDLLRKEWAAMAEQPTEEEQASLLLEVEAKAKETFGAKALELAKQETAEQLEAISQFGFNGVCVQLPTEFELFTKENVTALLSTVTAKCGGDNEPYLVIEAPFEEARAEIEKATWIVFNRPVLEHLLANFSNEAKAWPSNRYLPSADFTDKENEDGFKDETHFTIGNLSRMHSIQYWQAPNKAGVAYYHTEKDATTIVETMPYGTLTSLIDKHRALNK
ncbi:MAG: hypothetical protein Q4E10_01590 [Porphyromonas sp.]|nr:hypothetical protein [Porphyromonas sp.]